MGKKSGRKENSRHCGEKTSYFFRHRPYPKKTDIIAPVFTEQTAESAPRRNKFICRRNTYPRSASREEEKRKDTVFHVPPTGPVSILTSAWKK